MNIFVLEKENRIRIPYINDYFLKNSYFKKQNVI